MDSLDLNHFSSFRELDVREQQAKGWAFKRFKSMLPQLQEGQDFLWFEQHAQAATIEQLRQQGRIYASTANLVMLSPSGIAKITQEDGSDSI